MNYRGRRSGGLRQCLVFCLSPIFKLRLGASIPRSVGWSVCLSTEIRDGLALGVGGVFVGMGFGWV